MTHIFINYIFVHRLANTKIVEGFRINVDDDVAPYTACYISDS